MQQLQLLPLLLLLLPTALPVQSAMPTTLAANALSAAAAAAAAAVAAGATAAIVTTAPVTIAVCAVAAAFDVTAAVTELYT